jgi:polysaccharide biosynthesis/export protein
MNILLLLWLVLQAPQNPDLQTEKTIQRDYLIGAGDVLKIDVFGVQGFDQFARVSNSGRIHVPYVGVLKVHNMSASQLEKKIAAALVERELVKEPWVKVQVVEYRAHPVYILGEVQQPGQFLLTKPMTVMDLITYAGAFSDAFSPTGYLYRYRDPADLDSYDPNRPRQQEVIKIDFQALYSGKHPEMNLQLRGGDVLYVAQRKPRHFYVVGDVLKPGAVPLLSEEPMLFTEAISRAGGPAKTAKMRKGILLRYDDAGNRQEIPVNFDAILKGRNPNLQVLADDIIFIPGSTAKTLGYGLLGMIPGLAQGIAVMP